MPLVVDKKKIEKTILDAFEACIRESPMSRITLRQVAQKAGMSHQRLLYYYPSKEALVIAYCEYAREYMASHCEAWFASHDISSYPSTLAYMNDFMKYVALGGSEENRPQATIQTYILAQYNPEIQHIVKGEFETWKATMEKCLKRVYGDKVGPAEAEAMMVLITGTFVCTYTKALSSRYCNEILTLFHNLD